ncbi:MAG: SAM-dependent methyltransferase, partial [Clostridia bacterium]|nr:SAM-dependent methyltransferase [Clostridia bacterium]
MKKIIVVPLSTGGEELLTSAAAKALEEAEKLLLRTRRHPIERYLTEKGISWESLDALYDECEDFDIFNRAAVIRLLEMSADRTVCYGVADPAMDSTVATLMRLKPPDIQVEVLPGVSHADRCLAMLQPQNANVRLCAASQFLATRISPETPLLLCELHSRECAGDCKLKLLELLPPETSVDFFEGDEQGRLSKHTISLCELDRQKTYDHMTAAYTPGLSILSRRRFDMDDLTEIMTRLRGPEGCP